MCHSSWYDFKYDHALLTYFKIVKSDLMEKRSSLWAFYFCIVLHVNKINVS